MSIWWSSSVEDANNNWDLHAVVRGCRRNLTTALDPLLSCVDSFINEEVVVPNIETTKNAILDELEELCRPFFSNPQQPSQEPAVAVDQPPEQEPQRRVSHNLRSKRRKNQQKKVVCQVPADGVSPDMWAWRKYGQKPIKGSPYPRGYYRCSSSKGCLARKQVERNRTDPTTLIITYTAEHNHPVPTHRNSLAGSTRSKFPDKSSTPNNRASSPLSTLTPLTASMEDELLMPKDDVQEEINGDDSGDDMVSMDSEKFSGESEKLFSDTWQVENSTAAAAGAGVR